MKRYALLSVAPVALVLLATSFAAEFEEQSGRVSAEAENATSHSWKVIAGKSGKALEDPGNGSIKFTIHFRQAGKFYLAVLGGTNVCGGDGANDMYVKLDGEKLYGSDGVTRPDGMRFGNSWCEASLFQWSQVPKGPGSHTPENIKNNPVYCVVKQPGKSVLELSHRSTGTRIDKIVLNYGKAYKPSGTGPNETVAGSTDVWKLTVHGARPVPALSAVAFDFLGRPEDIQQHAKGSRLAVNARGVRVLTGKGAVPRVSLPD